MVEQRKSVRYDLELPARISVETRDPEDSVSGHTRDVSNGGAFVIVKHPIPAGAPLSLELELGIDKLMQLIGQHDKKVMVSVDGHVVRSDGDGVAVAFGRKYNFLAV
jgi:hypothetical protein